MLGHKKGVKNQDVKEQIKLQASDQLSYHHLIKEDINDPKYQWSKLVELKNDQLGYAGTVYKRPKGDGAGRFIIRFDVHIKNATGDQMCELFKYGPPIDALKERRPLREIEEGVERLIYIKIGNMMMSDRD